MPTEPNPPRQAEPGDLTTLPGLVTDPPPPPPPVQTSTTTYGGGTTPDPDPSKTDHSSAPGPVTEDALSGELADATSTLIAQGYDPTRAAEIAAQLLSSAAATPSLASGGYIQNISPGSAATPQAGPAGQINPASLADLAGYGTGIPIGNTGPVSREVTPDELVSNQLNSLLAADSPYIRAAQIEAMNFANQRGQLGSSFAAGAGVLAAYETALPIATADAATYEAVATANLLALNNHALAELERAASYDIALLSSNTSIALGNLDAQIQVSLANLNAATAINLGNLDAETSTAIANLNANTSIVLQNMQSELELTMQSRQLTNDVGLAQLTIEGNVQLALLDYDLQMALEQFGFEGEIFMANLNHEQQIEVQNIIDEHTAERLETDLSVARETQHANMVSQASINYMSYISSFSDVEMDAAAAARLMADARANWETEIDLINGLYPDFPPILMTPPAT